MVTGMNEVKSLANMMEIDFMEGVTKSISKWEKHPNCKYCNKNAVML